MIRLRAGAATDPGRVRSNNQDRVVVVDGQLFAVADGMGGHRGGEVAAQMVTDGLAEFASAHPLGASPSTVTAQLTQLNGMILERAATSDDLLGMGTTLTMLTRADPDSSDTSNLLVVNIGDSRTYRLLHGELEQLTDDHSVVGDLIREGRITAEEAKTHRQRSVITRALGVDATVEPDVLEIIPAPGSRYLLCSDGLSNELPDAVIGSVLRRLSNPQEAARELIRLALERGARDNVSVIVVDVVDDSGHDELALRASDDVTTTLTTSSGRATANVIDAPTAKPGADSIGRSPKRKGGPRKPWPVNLRVLLFLALLAALAYAVFAVVKSSPEPDPGPITTPTTVIETPGGGTAAIEVTTTVFVGPTTTIDDFAPAAPAPAGSATTVTSSP